MAKSLYDRRWQKRRAEQLRKHPLCALCMKTRGEVRAATVADHITPHRGDPKLFAGPLQSLCKPCHDSYKQELETTGHVRGCDLNGYPIDPNHPWNVEARAKGTGGPVRKERALAVDRARNLESLPFPFHRTLTWHD